MSEQPKIVPGLADVPVAESAVSFIDGKCNDTGINPLYFEIEQQPATDR